MASPTAFSMKSPRAIILLGDEHKTLCLTIAVDALKKLLPAETFRQTSEKLTSFSHGSGTVLFFEDTAVVEA